MELDKRVILLLPIISGIMWSSGGVFTRILHSYGFGNISIFSTRVILATIILFVVLFSTINENVPFLLNSQLKELSSFLLHVTLLDTSIS